MRKFKTFSITALAVFFSLSIVTIPNQSLEKIQITKTIQIELISVAHADPPAPAPTVIPVDEVSIPDVEGKEITDTVSKLLDLKNLTPAGIAVLIVQVLLLLFRSPLGKVTGVARLLIVQGLSIVLGYFCFWAAGAPALTAILDATMLGFVQVFANQLIKQIKKQPEDAAKLPT